MAAIMVLGPVVAVGAVLAAPGMTLNPSQGTRDLAGGNQRVINVSGDLSDAAGPFNAASVYWDVEDIEHRVMFGVPVNANGTFSFELPVPLYVPTGVPVRPGLHTIVVCIPGRSPCGVGQPRVTGQFRIPAPAISLSKTSGRQGDSVTLHGVRFSPPALKEQIRVTWDPSGTSTLLYEDYPGASTFDVTFVVPNVPAGSYTIRACNVPVASTNGACNSLDSATTQFTILAPVVSLDHTSGLAGATVNISGSRFRPQSSVHLFFGPPGTPIGDPSVHEISPGVAKTTNADGVFGPYAYAPTDAPGSYVVIACTYLLTAAVCNSNDTDTAPYTILAPSTPSPTPSPTPTRTPTSPPTATPTTTVSTPTPTASSPTPTATGSASPTPTASSPTPTATGSSSPSPSITPSPSASATSSALPTAAPPASPSAEPSSVPPTPISTASIEPGATPPAPSATPSASEAPVAITWPEHLIAPGSPRGFGDLATVGAGALLALLIAFLIPFPGTLFNKTVEANYAEIQGWLKGIRDRWTGLIGALAVGPLGAVSRPLGRAVAGRAGVLVFLALTALVYGFLSPSFGFDWNSAALFLGLLVGLAFITAAFDLPLRVYHGRRTEAHDSGILRALWWTLLAALVCVAVSRLAGFQPGYLYGLIISIVFVTEMSTRDEGIGVWLASVWLLVLSVVAWILLAVIRQQSADPWLTLFLQTVLVTFVVAGIETLVIGLLPMRFLPGLPLFRWRKSMWFALFALSVFGYLMILVDPANGYLSDDSRTPMIVGIIFLVVFGIVSIGTWAYFRFRPTRPNLDRPGEAASP